MQQIINGWHETNEKLLQEAEVGVINEESTKKAKGLKSFLWTQKHRSTSALKQTGEEDF